MSEKRNYEKEDKIADIHHFDDRLTRGEEISNESRVQFTNPSSNLVENSVSAISGNVSPETNIKVKKPTSTHKSQNVINVILISAAASGSTVLGVGAILKTPSVNVSLFSRNSTSLTFEVGRVNIDNDDRLVALLSYQEDEMAYDILNINEQSQSSINEKFITYYELNEHTPYTFKVLYYPDYNALDSEGNPIDNSEITPKTLYSSAFETSDYSEEVGIELDPEYNHESLSFTVYNFTPLPFVSVRLVTFSNKELFVKDTSEQEVSFTVNNLPYDEDY